MIVDGLCSTLTPHKDDALRRSGSAGNRADRTLGHGLRPAPRSRTRMSRRPPYEPWTERRPDTTGTPTRESMRHRRPPAPTRHPLRGSARLPVPARRAGVSSPTRCRSGMRPADRYRSIPATGACGRPRGSRRSPFPPSSPGASTVQRRSRRRHRRSARRNHRPVRPSSG